MIKQTILCLTALSIALSARAQTTVDLPLNSDIAMQDAPVVVDLSKYGQVRSALVTIDGQEVPCQLDDLNGDGTMDELCFITSFNKCDSQQACITLYPTGTPKVYPSRTYAEIVLRDGNKQKNRQGIYLSNITIDKATKDPYHVLHHHGVAFENELIALRIYMDKRQTIDLYGKYHKGLELKETQFYTSKEQKAQGYGDDVLWVGNTFGLGALRGWNGKEPTMIDNVAHRSQRILTQGPVRTIVEMEDNGWTIDSCMPPVNMTLRYTLYAGHRDVDVDVTFNCNMNEKHFATGIINVKGSTEYSDHDGLRGCWGTDYPSTDTVNWKRETVGLGIYIPKKYLVSEQPTNKDNYAFVVSPSGNKLHYSIAYTSDNEDFGYHSAKAWFDWLKKWRKVKSQKESPLQKQ